MAAKAQCLLNGSSSLSRASATWSAWSVVVVVSYAFKCCGGRIARLGRPPAWSAGSMHALETVNTRYASQHAHVAGNLSIFVHVVRAAGRNVWQPCNESWFATEVAFDRQGHVSLSHGRDPCELLLLLQLSVRIHSPSAYSFWQPEGCMVWYSVCGGCRAGQGWAGQGWAGQGRTGRRVLKSRARGATTSAFARLRAPTRMFRCASRIKHTCISIVCILACEFARSRAIRFGGVLRSHVRDA